MFFKAYRLQGSSYISNFFTPRVCHYNLRSSALNVSQPVNTSSHIHSSFSYIISHSWNQLPSSVKSATTLAEFKTGLSRITTLGCKCNKCISIQLQGQGYELVIRLQGQGYKLGDQDWKGFRGGSGLGLGVGGQLIFLRFFFFFRQIYIQGVCKSIFAWNSAQYVEAERNKYFKRKKRTQLYFPDKPVS